MEDESTSCESFASEDVSSPPSCLDVKEVEASVEKKVEGSAAGGELFEDEGEGDDGGGWDKEADLDDHLSNDAGGANEDGSMCRNFASNDVSAPPSLLGVPAPVAAEIEALEAEVVSAAVVGGIDDGSVRWGDDDGKDDLDNHISDDIIGSGIVGGLGVSCRLNANTDVSSPHHQWMYP